MIHTTLCVFNELKLIILCNIDVDGSSLCLKYVS
jgi:hypothetical protein